MPICEVIGYGVDLGPLKLFPIAGPEIPVRSYRYNSTVELTSVMDPDGEICGIYAEIVDPNTVELISVYGGYRIELPFRRLEGRQINRDLLTKGRLRWVKEVCSNIGLSVAEAVQLPDPTL